MGVVYLLLFVLAMIALPIGMNIEKNKAKLAEQIKKENRQRTVAHTEGLYKYIEVERDEDNEYKEGVAAMRRLGHMLQQSVYQEKESDWATWGGMAAGIAGPAAGVATATQIMLDNEKIRAANEARRQWGAQQNKHMQDLANQAERRSPGVSSMSKIKEKYVADMSWNPDTLFAKLTINGIQTEIDPKTHAVDVKANWKQDDRTICIDGALRAKLYTRWNKCAGCAYLILPKTGTATFKGSLSGICAQPRRSSSYTVKVEPVNLWELAAKDNAGIRETDNLTAEQHKKIVKEYELNYQKELNA